MKTCKVKPLLSTCSACLETQEMFGVVDDCNKCKYSTDTYELVQIKAGLFFDSAFVQKDGKIERVSLDRIYDIKED